MLIMPESPGMNGLIFSLSHSTVFGYDEDLRTTRTEVTNGTELDPTTAMEFHRVVTGCSRRRLLLALRAARAYWLLGLRHGNDVGVLRLCQLWRSDDCMGALASVRRRRSSASVKRFMMSAM